MALQSLCEHPQCAIQFHILINAINCPRCRASALLVAPGQTAFDGVFLDSIEGGPKVAATVLPTAWHEQLGRSNRRRSFCRIVAIRQGSQCKGLLLVLV
ncbi:hypothetical protein CFBP6109_P200077 (plasmid) [Pseudomonas syringae pv. cerasicola]|uniref:Uncharacterized protein n=1 Tax=Pseudomonas syringae pv. cerasicola TaxID=264451 RepID=A0A330JXU6_PSESX|nr:hypothetical protein ALP61_200057 [Pseudomonas savastanoi]RMT43723.1 hypothetical protein ALP47_200159 [Pseudomonas savastanoi]SOS31238.1 hypothetical protein CFBP6109_P200077 [Pseudomonas syringae pv. cerasicola]SPD89432.1 hypothetical protein PSCFBP6110_P200014 [Pseudomonas syringae pv. cerasicola]